jgi:putative oxidoreductase
LQRLFSTFPGGLPGAGLLLLRLSAAVPMIVCGVAEISASPQSVSLLLTDAALVSGVMILVGLWTPVAALVATFLQLWIVFSRTGFNGTPILLASLAASLVMLGPGAWSIDARIFGRRRIIFPD